MTAPDGKPRGVLHPQLTQGEFQHERRLPSAPLAELVEHYCLVRWDLRMLTQRVAPDVDATDAGMAAMYAVADDFLLAQLPPSDPDVTCASALVAAIAADIGMTSVESLMATAALDKRALQRLFQKYVGIGPKWVIKRYRLHEAIARMQDGAAVSWAALAQELGYYDQAHFGRDFRALVGRSPSEYARTLADAKARS